MFIIYTIYVIFRHDIEIITVYINTVVWHNSRYAFLCRKLSIHILLTLILQAKDAKSTKWTVSVPKPEVAVCNGGLVFPGNCCDDVCTRNSSVLGVDIEHVLARTGRRGHNIVMERVLQIALWQVLGLQFMAWNTRYVKWRSLLLL